MIQQNQQKDVVEQWNEFCKMEEENSKEKEKMATKKRKMMEDITKGFFKKDEEIGKLQKENRALKLKIAKMEADLKYQNVSIRRRMPSELLNEFFSSMPLENAFGLLTKMPNGILARNVQKMINGIKDAMKNNKLNEENCGPKLIISKEEIEVKHSGPDIWNCVRAVLPIPSSNLKALNKPMIFCYFEMEILNGYYIVIEFCDLQLAMEGRWNRKNNNSIGIASKYGIWIDGFWTWFENTGGSFKKEDFVGIGIIRHPNIKMECFTTLNGELLRKVVLPAKFVNIQLFPAINLYKADDSIRVNFGKYEWKFTEFKSVLA